jgi:hypothetical protein
LDSNATGIHTLSNVGIGTTNAESKLTVSGDVRITGVTTITGNYFYVGNPDITSDLTSGVILDTSGKITHQSVGGETHIVGYFEDIESYALSKDGNLYLGGGNPDDGGNGGNITILGETGRIGIGSTLPTSALTVERYGVGTGFSSFTATAGIAHTADSFTISSTDFKTVEYTIHVGYGSSIQAQKVLVMQNGTSAYSQEYAVIYQPDLLVSIGATVNSGQFRLLVTPEPGVNGIVTYRFTREAMI